MFPPLNPVQTQRQYEPTTCHSYMGPNDWRNGGQAPGYQSYPPNQPSPMMSPPVDQFSSMSIQQPLSTNERPMHHPNENNYQTHWQPNVSYGSVPPISQHYPVNQPLPSPAAKAPPASLMPPIPPHPQNVNQFAAQYNENRSLNSTGMQPAAQQWHPSNATLGPPQPSRRVNADAFPSAVEVIETNRAQCSGFCTAQRSVVPPLVTTNFSCRDEGNCNPRFIRSSMYAVPASSDVLKTVGIPFTVTISPFACLHPDDQPLMLSDMGSDGPVRCTRCRAYMNPFVSFLDGGRRFRCPLCRAVTSVPDSYFAHLDHTGRRTDIYLRPELCLGSYELTTTVDYCKNAELPNPPAFLFLLDVSQTSIRSGLVHLFCSQFVDYILPRIPRDMSDSTEATSQLKVGFITYDHRLHFYSLVRESSAPIHATQNGGGEHARIQEFSRPQMHIVADVEDVFVPAVDGFLVTPDPPLIESLLHLVPSQLCADPTHAAPDAMLGPAIRAGLEALRAANRSGKLFVFHSNLPTADGPGKLKNREDPRLIGTDKERTLLMPFGDYYTNLGQACVEAGCSVDLFLFPNAFTDVATLAEVPRLTSGHLYKYNCFQADLQGVQFLSDLEVAVSRPIAFNAVLRVRTSAGIRPVEFFGNFCLPNTTDVEMACVDPDTSLTVEIKHDDKLEDKDVAFIQVACLYTALSGQRRLRIHNLSLSTTSSVSEVFRLIELDTHMNWLFKFALRAVCNRNHPHVVDELTTRTAQTLAAYRRHCSGGPGDVNAGPGELVLPQNMRLYPLYVQCLMKSDAFIPADSIPIDERSRLMFLVNGMDIKQTNIYLYPRIYPVNQLTAGFEGQLVYPPSAVRCSFEYLQSTGAYLLDNGVNLFLWLGANLSEDWIHAVLVGSSVGTFEPEKLYELPQLDSEASRHLRYIISRIHDEHSRHTRLLVVRSGDKLEPYFKRFLVEDRFGTTTVSYAEYLCHIHKEISNLLR